MPLQRNHYMGLNKVHWRGYDLEIRKLLVEIEARSGRHHVCGLECSSLAVGGRSNDAAWLLELQFSNDDG